ncbi:hypothetical protein H310_12484 [Aphanomyces invadans]|uniref:FYVE-type domain-containing protein n=1 Tax=Aphanomyces invadans TaxID=157072 RepID=A0A024THT3_9STRA|nr:hypothetical protein H310_12484 [Aphanomyces invadans]ETV93720.1 hypothetical protein H310_12484 [Aphanomyces invadans]|eukprot:XP_008877761.1 hypothetical protein H310_12484 [Aphanomyces invadans]
MYALFVAAKSIVNDTKGTSIKDRCHGCHRAFVRDRKTSTCRHCVQDYCTSCIERQKGPRRVCVKCSDSRSSSMTHPIALPCRQRFYVHDVRARQRMELATSYERPTEDTWSSDSLCRPSELSPLATSMSCAVDKSSWEIWSEEDDLAVSHASDSSCLEWRGHTSVLLEPSATTRCTNRPLSRPQMNPALQFTPDGTLEHRDLHWSLAIPQHVPHG